MGPQDFGDEKPGVRPTCPEELLSQGLDIMTDVPRLTFASRRDFHNSEVLKKTSACNGPFFIMMPLLGFVFVGDFFTDCTMVNHHLLLSFGRVWFTFSKHLKQIQDYDVCCDC